MKLHEYQGKDLFEEYGIPVTQGEAVNTGEEAVIVAEKLGLPVVIKAQVHVGGRGKAGGVKIVDDVAKVKEVADKILSLEIKELPVRKLLVVSASDIATEVYLSLLIDRNNRKLVFIGCADGGVEIEETAKTNPEKIKRLEIGVAAEFDNAAALEFAKNLFESKSSAEQTVVIMKSILEMYKGKDCELIEINPLIEDPNGKVIALDAKVLLDDNALFRHADNEKLRDMDSEDLDELKAKEDGLSFIRLDGKIGCMVNGAGLAMATMDTIKLYDGEPANFLDVGGSSNPKKVISAIKIILKDKKVSVILINIFGGITRCDDIAQGLLDAKKEMDLSTPIVIRLVGTNEKEGRALLEGSEMESATSLADGARKAIEMGGRGI